MEMLGKKKVGRECCCPHMLHGHCAETIFQLFEPVNQCIKRQLLSVNHGGFHCFVVKAHFVTQFACRTECDG